MHNLRIRVHTNFNEIGHRNQWNCESVGFHANEFLFDRLMVSSNLINVLSRPDHSTICGFSVCENAVEVFFASNRFPLFAVHSVDFLL